jgi:uncharacterized integral membrane protein
MAKIKLIVAIVFALLGLILIVQNTTPVTVRLFFWSQPVSLSVLLLAAMGIGAVLGMCIALFLFAKRK